MPIHSLKLLHFVIPYRQTDILTHKLTTHLITPFLSPHPLSMHLVRSYVLSHSPPPPPPILHRLSTPIPTPSYPLASSYFYICVCVYIYIYIYIYIYMYRVRFSFICVCYGQPRKSIKAKHFYFMLKGYVFTVPISSKLFECLHFILCVILVSPPTPNPLGSSNSLKVVPKNLALVF